MNDDTKGTDGESVEDKEAEHKSKAEQLQMLFDELDPDDEP